MFAFQGLLEYGAVTHSVVMGLQAGAGKVVDLTVEHARLLIGAAVVILVLWSFRVARHRG